jgi:hypothetical protein
MPSVVQLIKTVARTKQVQQYIVEKDYALSYLLSAIASNENLNKNLVLKGGTALRKLYFPDYRFSEDLDYSTRVTGPVSQIETDMEAVMHQMMEDLNLHGPFQVTHEPLMLHLPHPGDQKAFIIHVQFPGQRRPLCRLKVEITVDEPILSKIIIRPVIHNFEEKFEALIPAYSLLEITAEKLRALLQSKIRLRERGWGASRVCRDYYDLWNLLQISEVVTGELYPLLIRKFAVRDVSFESPYDFISDDLIAVAENEWQQQLMPFVPYAFPASEILPQVKNMILHLGERN